MLTPKKEIVRLVNNNLGSLEAGAVLAAIEIAAKTWSKDDTKKYGTALRDTLFRIETGEKPEPGAITDDFY